MIRNDFGYAINWCWVTLFVRISYWGQFDKMNCSSINFDSCWKLLFLLRAESHIIKTHCSWCITILGYTAQSKKLKKFINIYWSIKSLWRCSITPLEVSFKDFVHISYENASFRILECSSLLQLIYFVTKIAFWLVKYLSLIDEDTLN